MGEKYHANCLQHKIVIDNLKEHETLTFSFAILKGSIINNLHENNSSHENCGNQITVKNETYNKTTCWPILKSRYKCLIELSNGNNKIVLSFCDALFEIILNYEPRKTEYYVIPVYIICKNHDGKFQAPLNFDNSVESACRRIFLGTKLIQTLIAEKLFECNFGRKTFQMKSDVDNETDKCIRFYSNLNVEEARTMDQEALWVHFGREIMKSDLCSNKHKFLAFLSATWWDSSPTGQVKAHAALGGGGLALFGTGCLYTWPECVEDVIKCFLDATPVDTQYLMDDSCFRGTYGGCFSTTLGSVCHELGHAFDLGHSKDGIMGRGFDNIDLVFLPLSNYHQHRHQCMQYTTVQLISKLNVECIITSPTTTMTSTTITDSSCFSSSLSSSSFSSNSKELINSDNQSNQLSNNINNNSNDKKINNSNVINNHSIKQPPTNGNCNNGTGMDDKTFWSPSCASLLAYHRWFINETEDTLKKETLKYDKLRGIVMSSAGIRVVELRGENGLVLHSWQFTSSRIKHQLVVPLQVASKSELIVIEDSYGNILKQELKSRHHHLSH